MGHIGCPETSVRNYHNSLRNDPEERSSRLLRGGSEKSRCDVLFIFTVHKYQHIYGKVLLSYVVILCKQTEFATDK